MIKFNKINRLNYFNTLIIIIKNILWCFFYILQGRAIELAVSKNSLPKQLIYTLIGYMFFKILVMLFESIQKFIIELFKSYEVNKLWMQLFPSQIFKDNENKHNELNTLFFNLLPRMFELEAIFYSNVVNMVCIFTLTVIALIYSNFYLAAIGLFFVFLFNAISKNILLDRIEECHKDENEKKSNLLIWITQYLNSFREVSKNWNNSSYAKWKEQAYESFSMNKKKQAKLYFYRDLMRQLLVELPFLLNSSMIILGVYYQVVSLTQLFVWIGFCQLMITASNAFIENNTSQKEMIALKDKAEDIISNFKVTKPISIHRDCFKKNTFNEIEMLDGTKVSLDITPSIYRIKGKNASGKSTLLNIISGYERIYKVDFNHLQLKSYNIRVIDKESVVFDSLLTFSDQVLGPLSSGNSLWKEKLAIPINHLLNAELAATWMGIFTLLEKNFNSRDNKLLSSGERVILSFLRFLTSWDDRVKLIMIDECDAFLDRENHDLFLTAITEISVFSAIYITSHKL